MTYKQILGTEYEYYVLEKIKNDYEKVWHWKNFPEKLMYENKLICNYDIFNKYKYDIGADLVGYKNNIYYFIQCKNFSGVIYMEHLAGFYNLIAEHKLTGVVYYSGTLSLRVKECATNIKYINMPFNNMTIDFNEHIEQPLIIRDYQQDAYNALLNKKNSILNLPCGMGKTFITSLLAKNYDNIIILSPLRQLAYQTLEQYKYYLGTDYTPILISVDGCRDLKIIKTFITKKNIISSTYKSIDIVIQLLNKLNNIYIVIDEFHNLSINDVFNYDENICDDNDDNDDDDNDDDNNDNNNDDNNDDNNNDNNDDDNNDDDNNDDDNNDDDNDYNKHNDKKNNIIKNVIKIKNVTNIKNITNIKNVKNFINIKNVKNVKNKKNFNNNKNEFSIDNIVKTDNIMDNNICKNTCMQKILKYNCDKIFVSATPLKDFMNIKDIYKYNWNDAINNKYICDFNIYIPDKNENYTNFINFIKKFCNQNINNILLKKTYFMLMSMINNGDKKCICYATKIIYAKEICDILKWLCGLLNVELDYWEINCNTAKTIRTDILHNFKYTNKFAIIVNVHILDEGINIPECDSVFITQPNNNIINIIQRICRANRILPNKTKCNIYLWCNEKTTTNILKYIYINTDDYVKNKIFTFNTQNKIITKYNKKNINKDINKNISNNIVNAKTNFKQNSENIIDNNMNNNSINKNNIIIETSNIYNINETIIKNFCVYCNYQVKTKWDFDKHNESLKHITNMENFKNYENRMKLCCLFCDKIFETENEKIIHYDTCENIKQNEIIIKQNDVIVKQNNDITNLKNEIIHLNEKNKKYKKKTHKIYENYIEQITNIQNQHTEEIKDIQNHHTEEIKYIQNHHIEEIKYIQNHHTEEIKNIKTQHVEEIKNIHIYHIQHIDELNTSNLEHIENLYNSTNKNYKNNHKYSKNNN